MTPHEELAQIYTALTGRVISAIHYDYSLCRFISWGFTADNLRTVLTYIIRENKKRTAQYQTSLRLSAIISDPEKFSDILAEAKLVRDKLRNHRPAATPKQAIQQAWSPVVVPDIQSSNTITGQQAIQRLKNSL